MKSLQAHPQVYPHPHPHIGEAYDLLFPFLWILIFSGLLFGIFKFIRHKKKKG